MCVFICLFIHQKTRKWVMRGEEETLRKIGNERMTEHAHWENREGLTEGRRGALLEKKKQGVGRMAGRGINEKKS